MVSLCAQCKRPRWLEARTRGMVDADQRCDRCMEAVERREKVRGLDMLVGLHDGWIKRGGTEHTGRLNEDEDPRADESGSRTSTGRAGARDVSKGERVTAECACGVDGRAYILF